MAGSSVIFPFALFKVPHFLAPLVDRTEFDKLEVPLNDREEMGQSRFVK